MLPKGQGTERAYDRPRALRPYAHTDRLAYARPHAQLRVYIYAVVPTRSQLPTRSRMYACSHWALHSFVPTRCVTRLLPMILHVYHAHALVYAALSIMPSPMRLHKPTDRLSPTKMTD